MTDIQRERRKREDKEDDRHTEREGKTKRMTDIQREKGRQRG